MQSYRIDSLERLIDFHGSDLGLCIRTLYFKSWGRTPVNNRPRKQEWWENRFKSIMSNVEIIVLNLKPESELDVFEIPTRYEDEMGWNLYD